MSRLTSLFIVFYLLAGFALAQAPAATGAGEQVRRGIDYLRASKFQEALDAFQAAMKLDPKSAAVRGNIGMALLGLKRPDEAAASFREATKLAPTDGTFQTALCRALVQTKKYEDAVKACEEGARLNPNSADASAALIEAMSVGSSSDVDTMRLIASAITRFRDSEQVLVVSAEYASYQRSRQLAVELWEQLVRLKPDNPYYIGRFAEACVDVDREAEAITAARRALDLDPKNAFAHYAMGRLFLELGQHGDASRAFAVAKERKDRLPYAQYYFGVSESRAGRTQSAIEAFRSAVRDMPDSFSLNLALGNTLNDNAQYEDAVAPLRRAVSLRPNDFEAKAALGLSLFESTQFQEGIKVLEEADRMSPGNEIVAMFLRVARARQADIPRIDEIKQYAKENPAEIAVRVNLIELLAFARRINEVEPYVQEFLALKPKEARQYYRIAAAYSTAGKDDKAMDMYRRALALGEDFGAYLGFAGIYAKRGQVDEASAAYARMLELKPDAAESLLFYAAHLRDNGKRSEALNMYRRSLAIMPNQPVSLSSAAILSAKLGELDAARTYIATLKSVDPEAASRIERVLVLLKYLN